MVDTNQYCNFSGGAYGADTYFDIIGRKYGFLNHIHFRPPNNTNLSTKLKKLNVKPTVITDEQLKIGYKELQYLYYKKLEQNMFNDLKARNYYQVLNSDGIFAIGELNKNSVKGGTDVAVQLGIKYSKEVYVYDYKMQSWYNYNFETKLFHKCERPCLTKKYAGVGTRNIEKYRIHKYGNWIDTPDYLGKEIEEQVVNEINMVYLKTLLP